jgi:hypothetical protein
VERLAQERGLWREYVDFPDDRRQFVSLYRDDYVDVWVLCWTRASNTGFHDHDMSPEPFAWWRAPSAKPAPRMAGQPALRVGRPAPPSRSAQSTSTG